MAGRTFIAFRQHGYHVLLGLSIKKQDCENYLFVYLLEGNGKLS